MPRVRELTIAYRPHPSGASIDGRSLTTPAAVAAVVRPMLEHEAQEVMIALLLNTKRKLIAVHEIGRGGLSAVECDPRILFRAALLINAAAIIVAHNHPSGDCTPSPADIAWTSRISKCGELWDIVLLDHVIVGDQCWTSLQEFGIRI